jgi:hypothetical protein
VSKFSPDLRQHLVRETLMAQFRLVPPAECLLLPRRFRFRLSPGLDSYEAAPAPLATGNPSIRDGASGSFVGIAEPTLRSTDSRNLYVQRFYDAGRQRLKLRHSLVSGANVSRAWASAICRPAIAESKKARRKVKQASLSGASGERTASGFAGLQLFIWRHLPHVIAWLLVGLLGAYR